MEWVAFEGSEFPIAGNSRAEIVYLASVVVLGLSNLTR